MKALKIGILAVAALVSISVNAQTVEEIIAKHIEAIGGKDKLSQIKSIYMETSVDVMGNQAPNTVTILDGKGYKSELDFNGQKVVQVFTDKGGWMINPLMGSTTPTPIPAEQLKGAKDQIAVAGPLFNYSEKGSKAELLGKEDVNGVNAFKIKLTNKEGFVSTYFIDPSNYYIIKAAMTQNAQGQEMETNMFFSDYKKTDFGFVVPYSIEIQLPQFTLKSTTKKVEVNKPVDENIFKAE